MPTPNMGLTVPIPGITPGPTYATDISAALALIDAHDHSLGNGAPLALIASGGLYLDGSQHLGIALDGATLAITALGLKLNSLGGLLSTTTPGAPSADGIAISGSVLSVTLADATHPGSIDIAAQTFSGVKSFANGVVSDALTSLTGVTTLLGILVAADPGSDVVLGSTNIRTSGNIVEIDNAGTLLATVDFSGLLSVVGIDNNADFHQISGGIYSDTINTQNAVTLSLTSSVADGGLAVDINTANAFTSGELLSIKNHGSEVLSVDWTGMTTMGALVAVALGTGQSGVNATGGPGDSFGGQFTGQGFQAGVYGIGGGTSGFGGQFTGGAPNGTGISATGSGSGDGGEFESTNGNAVSADSSSGNVKGPLHLVPTLADPSAPDNGDIWINSSTNTLKYRSGGVTHVLGP